MNETRLFIEQHRLGFGRDGSRYGMLLVQSTYPEAPEIKLAVYDARPEDALTTVWGADKWRPRIFVGRELLFDISNVGRGDLCRWAGLITFDTAVPQPWFNDYFDRHGRPPDAVWVYAKWDDKGGIERDSLGHPEFIEDFLNRLYLAAYYKLLGERIV